MTRKEAGRRWFRVLGAVLLGAALLVPVAAPAVEETGQAEPPPQPPRRMQAVENVQEKLSEQVVDFGERLDALFGIEPHRVAHEGSLVRLGTTALMEEGGISFDYRARARLALPRTEERLNIFLESEVEELFEDPTERGRRRVRDEDDPSFVAGLRYLFQFAEHWNFDLDGGIRVKLPLDPYVRGRVSRDYQFERWNMRLGQSLFWYAQDGEGTSSELTFERQLSPRSVALALTDVTWKNRETQFYYAQDFMLSHRLREDRGLLYQIGIRGESEPNHQLESYFVNVRARRSVFWRWFFVEVRPELLFRREQNFELEPRLFVTFEAVFGDLDELRWDYPSP